MQTSLIDYSTISHDPVYPAPKSLGMAHRQELTYGIKLVFHTGWVGNRSWEWNLPEHFKVFNLSSPQNIAKPYLEVFEYAL